MTKERIAELRKHKSPTYLWTSYLTDECLDEIERLQSFDEANERSLFQSNRICIGEDLRKDMHGNYVAAITEWKWKAWLACAKSRAGQ